jgi:ABC-type branched-subunit amino acid transport system substrate-binding protein
MRRASRRPSIATFLTLCILLTGCGLRVDEVATSPTPGSGGAVAGGTKGASATASNGGQSGTQTTDSGQAGTGQSATGAPTDGGTAQAVTDGQDQSGVNCTTNPGETAPGVTGDQILVGGVTGEGGPADSTLSPFKMGFESAIAEINAGGGICGRQMKVIWAATAGSADRYGQQVRNLVESQHVFVLTAADLAHQGGAQYLADNKVPVIGGESAANTWFQNPMYFPIGNQYNGTAEMADWAVKQGRATKFAVLSLSLAVSQEGCASTTARLQQLGAPIVYQASVPVGSADLTSFVQQARAAGADGVLQCFDIGTGVALMRTLEQQQWKPYVGAVSGSADQLMLSSASPSVLEGMEVNFPTPSWIDTDNPAIQQYNRSYAAVEGADARNSSFGIRGYIAAKLMEAAFRAVGPQLTRDAVISWLNSQSNFALGGLLPPDTTYVPDAQGFHQESKCSREYAIRNGQFVLVSPGDGWVCLDAG